MSAAALTPEAHQGSDGDHPNITLSPRDQIRSALQESLAVVRAEVHESFERYGAMIKQERLHMHYVCVEGYGSHSREGSILSRLDCCIADDDEVELARFVFRLRSAVNVDFRKEYLEKYRQLLEQFEE
tara:strand:- start:838 stop:1221 length:384 start_codon:yes stop_codon:yes gene_type:complete